MDLKDRKNFINDSLLKLMEEQEMEKKNTGDDKHADDEQSDEEEPEEDQEAQDHKVFPVDGTLFFSFLSPQHTNCFFSLLWSLFLNLGL